VSSDPFYYLTMQFETGFVLVRTHQSNIAL